MQEPQEQTPTVLSYHGGGDRRMYIYKSKESPPGLHICDYVDPVERICSNHKKIKNNSFECQGHEDGDFMYPSYHGLPSKGERIFFVYPRSKKLEDPRRDFYDLICNNCEQLEEE
jgi:hypothetical protein